jgi:hypothetical protein
MHMTIGYNSHFHQPSPESAMHIIRIGPGIIEFADTVSGIMKKTKKQRSTKMILIIIIPVL